ncbi:MAG: tRNA (adenosine(37)-N6)-threonylcarbamoyltransferase complex dimerization subunit type 1 TsaB [Fulvimarina manganoxydans]|uniref:tRNA (adenosine(37)-N6)-threonylcarbamoyltransferase complex dimerization subunit type 1 TsaB n=1 Tax=Fulvimarina manganoxydans TaxID=937218 RepID=UPI0023534AAE|nr:tRNA (adenosine(37)-N6)-threonylcarbamoyltransferase complex dimerization subunit type 1 TsaB [Fulvimarina manganoxydans]MCK5931568.1 tRNA (adenosine(37)-N6)-threonylcarbamoyltransferase complex dimerization subunit type 1 TsaB [Fulvimarina manganoxydans]
MSAPTSGLVLAIDTAFDACSVAVFDPLRGAMVACASEELGKGHAERLPGMVDAVLAQADTSFGAISRIGATIGPGSFTGIRVCVSAARAYGLALGVPVVGVVTLHAMAEAWRRNRPILAVHDAKRGEVYSMLLSADGEVMAPPSALAPDKLPEWIAQAGGAVDLVGSGAAVALAVLAANRPEADSPTIVSDRSAIDMSTLARLSIDASAQHLPKPLYLRSADAKPPSRRVSLFDAAS